MYPYKYIVIVEGKTEYCETTQVFRYDDIKQVMEKLKECEIADFEACTYKNLHKTKNML